jgi:hypothetical protein
MDGNVSEIGLGPARPRLVKAQACYGCDHNDAGWRHAELIDHVRLRESAELNSGKRRAEFR